MPVPYETEWLSRNVVTIRCRMDKPDDVFWFLVTSDVHWDNAHSDRLMFKRHLEECKERNAGWIDNGDMQCLMQGKFDPRSDQSQLRPEHRGNDYLDRVVNTLHDFVAPYAEHAIAFGHGNHETNTINRHNCDQTERLCAQLAAHEKSPVRCHGIAGWVQFRLYRGTQIRTINLFRHHGYGGGAPVSKGVLSASRIGLTHPDANIVIQGHDHNEWIFPIPRVRLTMDGVVRQDEQLHCRVPGYKGGHGDEFEGWENVKGFPPKNRGALWLKFYRRGKDFHYEAERAK